MKTIDQIFPYEGYHGCKSHCRVRIYQRGVDGDSIYTVLLTETQDNPGTSVTNCVEHIASKVWAALLPSAGYFSIGWIEHYPRRGRWGDTAETFDLVTFQHNAPFTFSGPAWTSCSREWLEGKIGEAWPGEAYEGAD